MQACTPVCHMLYTGLEAAKLAQQQAKAQRQADAEQKRKNSVEAAEQRKKKLLVH